MKIAVLGTGYVGLVCAACFAQVGNQVRAMDVDQRRVDALRAGRIPIFEPGLETLVLDGVQAGRLEFTTSMEAVLEDADLVFIAVGTPMGNDGEADLSQVHAAASAIGRFMQKPLVVVDKSTVPVGTADQVESLIFRELADRDLAFDFDVVSNPEFLKEGSALEDFMRPDRVIIGSDSSHAVEVLREAYRPFVFSHDRFLVMDRRSAEMAKYAANSFLAAKISFMNEMAAICEAVGADVGQVRLGMGSDQRIGYHFLYAGAGYGGSCFPKDVRALERTALKNGVLPRMLQSVDAVNRSQKLLMGNKILARLGSDLSGMKIAVWGLAFKPGTDDLREAPALTLLAQLRKAGAEVAVHDPKAMDEARHQGLGQDAGIRFCDDQYQAVAGAHALVLMTEWKEYRSPDFAALMALLEAPLIFDGRNQYDADRLESLGFEYYGIGRGRAKARVRKESPRTYSQGRVTAG